MGRNCRRETTHGPNAIGPGSCRPFPPMAQILVVEDDADLREALRDFVEQSGHAVHTAKNGRDGLSLLKSQGGKIDLIVLDVLMPEMDGRTMLEEMKRTGHQTPVIVGSAVLGLVDLPPVAAAL